MWENLQFPTTPPETAEERRDRIVDQFLTLNAVTLKAIRSQNRTPRLVRVRQAIMCELQDSGFSTVEIGEFLERDHSTVCHGAKEHRKKLVAGKVDRIGRQLN